jgi:hypothetical protein
MNSSPDSSLLLEALAAGVIAATRALNIIQSYQYLTECYGTAMHGFSMKNLAYFE